MGWEILCGYFNEISISTLIIAEQYLTKPVLISLYKQTAPPSTVQGGVCRSWTTGLHAGDFRPRGAVGWSELRN